MWLLRTRDKEVWAHLLRRHPWEQPDLALGGLGTSPCPLLQHKLFPHPPAGDLVSFCPSPTGYQVGLGAKIILGLLGGGEEDKKVDKVGSSAHRTGNIVRLSFPAVFQACLGPKRVVRDLKVNSPSTPLRPL